MYSPPLKLLLRLLVFICPFVSFSQNCELDFTYTNTGSNMIIMINQDALDNDILTNGDSLGAFMYLDDHWICVGAIEWNGEQQTLAVWGNDAASDQQDGLMAMASVVLKTKSSGVIYDVLYSPEIFFEVNGIEIIDNNLNLIPICDDVGNIYGCTSPTYEEYNSQATVDNGTCQNLNVTYGCTIDSYLEYNPEATDDDGSWWAD